VIRESLRTATAVSILLVSNAPASPLLVIDGDRQGRVFRPEAARSLSTALASTHLPRSLGSSLGEAAAAVAEPEPISDEVLEGWTSASSLTPGFADREPRFLAAALATEGESSQVAAGGPPDEALGVKAPWETDAELRALREYLIREVGPELDDLLR
jgi:hypothetical protein